MDTSIIVVDDFFADPDAVVAYAKRLEYVKPYGENRLYASRFRPASECPFKSSTELMDKLERITGSRVDRRNWNLDWQNFDEAGLSKAFAGHVLDRPAFWNCTFHSKVRPKAGVLDWYPHDHTDRDTRCAVGDKGWVGIVYLDKKPADAETGLTTWENTLGLRHRIEELKQPLGNWRKLDTFANVYNRLILHRGDIFHSGSPGYGDSFETGRFYMTIFMRCEPAPAGQEGVRVRLGAPAAATP